MLQVMNIIVEYHRLYHTYINLFNKTTSIYLLLFLISFFETFSNISMSFDQFLPHQYFELKFPPIFPSISRYICKIKRPIYP